MSSEAMAVDQKRAAEAELRLARDLALIPILQKRRSKSDQGTGFNLATEEEEEEAEFKGNQLVVLGIPKPTVELPKILREISNAYPNEAPVVVAAYGLGSPGWTTDRLEFGYVRCMNPSHLMWWRRQISAKGYDVFLRPQKGNDRTRQIKANISNLGPLTELVKDQIKDQIEKRGVRVISDFADTRNGKVPSYYSVTINDRRMLKTVCANPLVINDRQVKFQRPHIAIPNHPYEMRMVITADESVSTIRQYLQQILGKRFAKPILALRIPASSKGRLCIFIPRSREIVEYIRTNWSYHTIKSNTRPPLLTFDFNTRLSDIRYRDEQLGNVSTGLTAESALEEKLTRELALLRQDMAALRGEMTESCTADFRAMSRKFEDMKTRMAILCESSTKLLAFLGAQAAQQHK